MVTLNAQERLSKAWMWARRSRIGAGLVLLVNFALPFLIYTIAKSSLGNVRALLIAASPPVAWTIIEFARTRRIDALSILALAGISHRMVSTRQQLSCVLAFLHALSLCRPSL
jgi:hypothetical protein